MKFGVDLPNLGLGGDPAVAADLAREAERAGWDGVFVWDSLYLETDHPGVAPTFDPWIALALVAAATEHVRIGPMVAPLARRRPWKVARETTSLDQLSGGRMVLPVASGDPSDGGFSRVGEPLHAATRIARLDEALAVVAGLWSGEPFTFEGDHFRVETMTFAPTPVQRPRIPVWLPAPWPARRGVARAHAWDGIMPVKVVKGESQAQKGWATANGLTPDEVHRIAEDRPRRPGPPGHGEVYDVVVGGATPGDDARTARALVAPYADAGATWWLESSVWQSMWKAPGEIEPLRRRIQQGPSAP